MNAEEEFMTPSIKPHTQRVFMQSDTQLSHFLFSVLDVHVPTSKWETDENDRRNYPCLELILEFKLQLRKSQMKCRNKFRNSNNTEMNQNKSFKPYSPTPILNMHCYTFLAVS